MQIQKKHNFGAPEEERDIDHLELLGRLNKATPVSLLGARYRRSLAVGP
jgi:hypothetical protein